MLSVLREKAVLTLVVLLLLGVGIGTAHDRALDHKAPFFIQDILTTVLRPSALIFHIANVAMNRTIRLARPRRAILRENAELHAEVIRLRTQNALLSEADQENARLRAALGLRQSAKLSMIPAEIISRKESTWFNTATMDRGRSAGVQKGWAVIATGWRLVGQVLEADSFSSRMVSLTDSDSAVGAMVQRSRCNGLLQGQGNDYLMLSYLPKDADVKVGDVVTSSGMGQVIPKGLVVGRVIKVVRNKVMCSTTALIRPSIGLDQIEQVFIVKPGQSVGQ